MQKFYFLLTGLAVSIFLLANANAEDNVISIKNHQFSPKELTIPANQKVKIIIKNLDRTVAEFESDDLNREKIVGGNSEVAIFVGPLEPGKYSYFDDFRRSTAIGYIIAK